MNLASRKPSLTILLAAGLMMAMLVALSVGIGATSYETTDSLGRPMGFNDPLHKEHYWSILRNFSPLRFFQLGYLYEWVLLALFLTGFWLLYSPAHFGRRSTRIFFAVQSLIFPFAWLGLGMMPGLIHNMFSGRLTREDFIDIPFLWVTAHTVWILTSLLIVFVMPGESLGLSTIGRRIYHAVARVLLFGSSRLK